MNIWKRIRGWKTVIGGMLHAAWFVYYMFIDKTIPSELQWRGHEIIFILTAVGIGDKVYRNKESIKNNINKLIR